VSAVTQDLSSTPRPAGHGWLAALRSTTAAEAAWVFAIAAALCVVNAFWLLEMLSKPDMQFKPEMVADVLLPLACAPFVLAA
jgi:hypothetical protein